LLARLRNLGFIEMTLIEKPNIRLQKYRLTAKEQSLFLAEPGKFRAAAFCLAPLDAAGSVPGQIGATTKK